MTGVRASFVDEDVRLRILSELAAQSDEQANEHILLTALEAWGHNKTRDYLRGQLEWLADVRAISVRKLGDVWVATLRSPGRDHVERRARIPGIKAAVRADD